MAAPWHSRGLAFECRRCRGCCRGAPGFVWVSPEEISRLAGALGLSSEMFAATHCRRVAGRVSLLERADGDCVFLAPEGCQVYEARPEQCRTFPFWPEIVRTPEAWARAGRSCPGIDQGRVYTPAEIAERLKGAEL